VVPLDWRALVVVPGTEWEVMPLGQEGPVAVPEMELIAEVANYPPRVVEVCPWCMDGGRQLPIETRLKRDIQEWKIQGRR
jgi:hypothetical protein